MGNHTYFEGFYILAFSDTSVNHLLLFFVFFLIYWTTVVENIIIITLVCTESDLHTPMFILLGNLSSLDIGFSTATVSKLMDILLSGYNSISYRNCFTQLYFFILFGSTEALVLSSMAYDRYLAICHPLQQDFFYLCCSPTLFTFECGSQVKKVGDPCSTVSHNYEWEVYGSVQCMYIRPPSEHSDYLDNVFSVLYTQVTPVLNPLVYSLRNNDVKNALGKFTETLKRGL
ncbi:hypothetical protein XELAEV_18043249mg [Xenopus laevis]|uniref:G-protein coupled receptors family 1 profile domain-containing protein n=1 Tax=Xenopus laevis TaxID=8355 RepID=A0A974H2L6_XENLA|nr:hypothetical protein XELAEV_18043249mg [Xenopus laevis]